MSTNARWVIGLLVAIVLGLAAGLIIVAGDEATDETDTVTVPTAIETRPPQTVTETETVGTETNGGGQDDSGPGNGGLGNP